MLISTKIMAGISCSGCGVGCGQITAGWLTAAKQGAYVLPSSALSKALARLENGLLTPGSLWWPLEASVAPAQALLRMVVRKSVSADLTQVIC